MLDIKAINIIENFCFKKGTSQINLIVKKIGNKNYLKRSRVILSTVLVVQQ